MNQLMDLILSRRSVRRYSGKTVTEELVREVLRAGMAAPSGHNQQPWEFVIIRDKTILQEITTFHPYSSMLPGADLAILVVGSMKRLKTEGFWVQDCAAATENMLLAAHSFGLGAVWLGIFPEEELLHQFSRLMELPPYALPFSLISLGYPAEVKLAKDRFDPERIHLNKW